jgi:RHS repeat-associated protein
VEEIFQAWIPKERISTRVGPQPRQESYVYDNNGNLSQFTDRKSQATSYTYDALNRRTGVTYAGPSTTTYTYDKGNRLTSTVDSISGTITRSYDGLDRLTSETTPQGSVSYTYDNAGRRATMTVSGQPSVVHSYDNANRLTQITQGSSVVIFTYDAAGRRDTLTLPNGVLLDYDYDNASRVTKITYKKDANVLGDLTYDYDKAGNRTKIGGGFARTGHPGAVTSTVYTLGSAIALADSAGSVQTEYTYEAFGGTTVTGASNTNSYQYTGRENDGTGLFYYRARFYHPALQRFISEDPIGFHGGDINLYGYVSNDPINRSDPSGQYGIRDFIRGRIIGAIGSTLAGWISGLGGFLFPDPVYTPQSPEDLPPPPRSKSDDNSASPYDQCSAGLCWPAD